MSSDTITLANAHFTIGNSSEDKLRRDQYFRNTGNPEFQLTDDERKVLLALGIDGVLETTLRPYLAKFFETLPSCQTDAAMMLAKNCEVPYYVIWSARFGARQAAKGRFEDNKRNYSSRSNIEMAENSAYISDLKPVPKSQDIVRDIFTLIELTKSPAHNTSDAADNSYSNNLFVIPTTQAVQTKDARTQAIYNMFTLIPVN